MHDSTSYSDRFTADILEAVERHNLKNMLHIYCAQCNNGTGDGSLFDAPRKTYTHFSTQKVPACHAGTSTDV